MTKYYVPEEKAQFTKDPMRQLYPLNKSNFILNEGVCFMKEALAPMARLLFAPKRIICLRDNSLQKEFVRGVDWEWSEKFQCLYLPEGSSIPYFTVAEARGEGVKGFGEEPVGFDEFGKGRIGNAVYCENEWHYGKTLYITYLADENETAEYPVRNFFKPELLPKTMKRLENKEHIKVVFFGDSTHTGADTTSWYKREPYMPGYPVLFCNALEKIYGCKIEYVNHSVGGTDSNWAVKEFERAVLNEKPDLLLLGFGNNDNKYAEGFEKCLDNMKYMLDTTAERLPESEIVLLGPSFNNPDSGFMIYTHRLITPYKAMQRVGLRYCDFFEMGLDTLHRKEVLCTLGNGIAHPNDWTTKDYVRNLLSLFVDWDDERVVSALRY